MAGVEVSGGNIEVFPWLKSLPVAPEYHPTLAEFQDPIAYIFKIEKEASKYGICKIIPPVPAPYKKTAIANLNKSLLARSNDLNPAPTFTTRQQQIGFCPRKHRPVQKPVWQSGENYTVSEFEAKAKSFEKSYLKKYGKKGLNALEIETLYWKATVDKPFSVEYANDMPGSAFVVKKVGGGKGNEGPLTVGETEWNMRGVSRAKSSLLRFMKEEIPGVTSPMVYIAMMFSWFAWHVEDHDLHSLNYMHVGAGKTWYGVPREAAVAFEEVIRVQGYGGEINPLVTFATLGEKTTVMSPEVLVNAGVPCCRLVQNAGEFVVTFPRAYHSGFSHGFNCGEAANIATPEWLRIAKDAAIRRASINCSPMVSHFQLLYDLALSLCSSLPKSICVEPRSSRLKDKKKSEGEMLIKELFSKDVMQNNNTLHILGKGSAVIVLPQNSLSSSNLRGGSQSAARSRLFSRFCSPDLELKTAKNTVCEDVTLNRNQEVREVRSYPVKGEVYSLCNSNELPSLAPQTGNADFDTKQASQFDRLSEQGLFSCVTCGILCFACVAIVQPTETAARYLMSADCNIFDDWEAAGNGYNPCIGDVKACVMNTHSGPVLKKTSHGLFDVPISSAAQIGTLDDDSAIIVSNSKTQKDTSSLGLLALMYDNSSDSEEEEVEARIPVKDPETKGSDCSEGVHDGQELGYYQIDSGNEVPLKIPNSYSKHGIARAGNKDKVYQNLDYSDEFETDNCKLVDSKSLMHSFRNLTKLQNSTSSCNPVADKDGATISTGLVPLEKTSMSFAPRSDEESSRMHVFCLQHAVQVEQRLSTFGGAHVFLVCHPDYPKLESQAKKVAEELKIDFLWNDTPFREATEKDEEMIRLALDSEDAIHGNGDWAVKLGINLYYSASLSRSPLYSKQMPYNAVVYNAFGRSSPADTRENDGKGSGKQRRIAVAGKWCGKVWMSSQVHPLLTNNPEDQELEKTNPTWAETDVYLGRPLDASRTAEATSTSCKTSRKRKSRAENRSAEKEKSLMAETPEVSSEESSAWNFLKQVRSRLGKKRMEEETKEPQNKGERSKKKLEALTEDEVEESPIRKFRKQVKSKLENKRRKKENPEPQNKHERSKKHFDSLSEDEVEEPSVRNSNEQGKSKLGSKRMKKETPEPQNTHEKSKKHIDPLSEDEVEKSPVRNSKQVKSKLGNKQMKKATPEPQNTRESSKKQSDSLIDSELEGWPGTRLRRRTSKPGKDSGTKSAKARSIPKMQNKNMITKKGQAMKVPASGNNAKTKDEEMEYPCNMEGCSMSFGSKQELKLHKRNICPVKACGKKFFSHKYLVQHRRVHMDDRPLKCPWKGCKMTFKWAWARTEHIRVHTGARPYVCTEAGCGQTFRFVSDFSRHKRKTGHSSKKSKG